MISTVSRALARSFRVLAIVLAVTAVLLTVLRLVLPLADRYREPVVAAIAEVLGHQVAMDGIAVRLVGLSPRFRFDSVTITDSRDPAQPLRFERLEVQVDLIRTLFAGYPVIEALHLVGAEMEVNRRADGLWQVRGLEGLIRGDPRPVVRFLSSGELQIEGGTVRIVDPTWVAQPPPLTDVRLRLVSRADRHRLDLHARPLSHPKADPGGTLADAHLRLLADLEGAGLNVKAWSGTSYLELGGADLSALVPPRLLPRERLPAVTESALIELWLDLGDGSLTDLRSRVGLRGLHLSPAALVPVSDPGSLSAGLGETLSFDRLTGVARLRADGDSWSLTVRDLAASVDGVDLPDLDLELELGLAGRPSPRRFELHVDALDLGSLSRLVGVFPALRTPLTEGLLKRAPRGSLTALGISADWSADGTARWRAALAGEGLGLDALDGLPGFDGLGVALRADERGGVARLGSTDLRLDLAPILPNGLRLDRLGGNLRWRRPWSEGWVLAGDRLEMGNADLRGRARFTLEIPPARPRGGPELDLRATLSAGDISRTGDYLPTGIMHPHLTRWLEHALVGGRLERADLILRGPIRAFPFAEHEGRFEVIARVEDGTLDYLEAWPPITQASATLRFVNTGLGIELHSGRLFDTPLLDARASIPDLRAVRTIAIAGRSQGPLSDATRLLRESPLSGPLGGTGEALQAQGELTLDLDLDVPLAQGIPLGLDGRATVSGPATLSLKDTPVTLTDLSGGFEFTRDSVTAPRVTASLWGRPVEIAVETLDAAEGEGAATEIRAQGRVAVEALAQHAPSPLWQLATGDTDLGLTLTLGAADAERTRAPVAFELRSDLNGLGIELPEPLGKAANTERPLRLTGTLEPGRSLDLRGGMEGLGLDLRLNLGGASPVVERGRVRLGASEAPAAESAGLLLDGRVDRLDLDAWSSWLRGPGAKLTSGAGASGLEGVGGVSAVDLRVERLDAGKLSLEDLRIQATPRSGEWEVRAEARDLAGRLVIPADASGRPWDLALERLDLAPFIGGPKSEAEKLSPGGPNETGRPRATPLDVRVSDLRWGETSLGRIDLEIRPEGEALRVPSIEFSGLGETRIKGRAETRSSADGMRSSVDLALGSDDTGPLLRALDYVAVLSAGAMEGGVELSWPGTLGTFSLASARGAIHAQMGQGRLLAVDPGLGRVIGFFNLGALSRRLSLDFSDMYDDGYAFESVDMGVRVEPGRAELRRFEMDGPAGLISATGFTDLVGRTFDQTVTVEPKIGSSVAIASAVAGGPVVGAAVYLVDKAAGGAIDKLGSFQYRITGPWDDPQIQRLGWEPFAARVPVADPGAEVGAGQSGSISQPRGGEPPESVNHFLD